MTGYVIFATAAVGFLVISGIAVLIASFRSPARRISITSPFLKYEGPLVGLLPILAVWVLVLAFVYVLRTAPLISIQWG